MLQSKASRWWDAAGAVATRTRRVSSSPGMGVHGRGRCQPIPVGTMHILGITISICAVLVGGVLLLRGAAIRVFRLFPLFYSYISYAFFATLVMYMVYWLKPGIYPHAFWINYLINTLAEFAVLVEISDHIFRPFVVIRNLGRALTVLISVGLGFLYILPTTLGSASRSRALLDFAMRAYVTKAVILIVLFYVARHYGSQLGRNVGGLMLGFSIYVAMNVTIMASAKAFGSALFAHVLWVMLPLASVLCMLTWTVSLWELAPMPSIRTISTATGRDSEVVALELTHFNSELSKLLHK